MIKNLDIQIVYNQRLDRARRVSKSGKNITSITMESGEEYAGKVFIAAKWVDINKLGV